MKKKHEQSELQELHKTSVFLMDIILTTSKTDSNQNEIDTLKEMFDKQNLLMADLLEKRNAKAIRYMINELELWIMHLPPQQIEQISQAYFASFGKYLGEDKILKKVNVIIERGAIKSRKDYELLTAFVELYNGREEKKKLLEAAAGILDGFMIKGIARKIRKKS